MPSERKPVKWDKLWKGRNKEGWGPISKRVEDLNEKSLKAARAKTGFRPANIIEALVFLRLNRSEAQKRLAEIFVAQGRTKEEALSIAKR